jgi:hypothetical protein
LAATFRRTAFWERNAGLYQDLRIAARSGAAFMQHPPPKKKNAIGRTDFA